LDDISIANNDVIITDDIQDDVNYFKLRRQRVGNNDKKQGLWKTMLIKIGVKHKKKVKRTTSNEVVEKKVEESIDNVFDNIHNQDTDKKKKNKFPKLPKKLNVFKSLRKKKSMRKASVYQSFKNDQTKEEQKVNADQEKMMEENDAEESKYMGRKVHLEMHSESYDLLEESGYETTSNSPVPAVTNKIKDTEFWSIEDISADVNDDRQQIVADSDSEDDFRNADEGAFQRGWKSSRAKSFRRVSDKNFVSRAYDDSVASFSFQSLRKSSKQTWKGLRQSLRHQMTFPTVHSVVSTVGSNKRR